MIYAPGGTANFEGMARGDVRVAGKTGSATASRLALPVRDERGNYHTTARSATRPS